MWTRVLASAGIAAALLAPATASAVTRPEVTTPTSTPSATNSAPTLVWNDVNDELGYRVFRADGTCAAMFADISGDLPAGTSAYLDSPPPLEGTYCYYVQAFDGMDDGLDDGIGSADSAPVLITYDATPPTAPGDVVAGAAPDGSVSIGWAASSDGAGSGIARYIVRRSLSSTPPATAVDGDATCQGTATSCTDSTTLNGKLYTYSVFAVDNAGNISAAGNSPAVTARDQTAPAAPTGLSATPGDASVSLSWTPAGADDDVAGYVLVAKQGAVAPASETDGTRVCNTIVATSSSCVAGGLANGAGYTFGLFALDEALNRSAAAVVSAAPNGHVDDTTAPAAVTKLRVKLVGHKVTLSWKNPADRDFDHVVITASERKPSAKKAARRVYSGKGTKTTTTLAAGQARWFVVVAYDTGGNASAPASVRAVLAPASPFRPAPRAKVHGKVRLRWPRRQARQVLQRAALRGQEAHPRRLACRSRLRAAARQARQGQALHLVRLARRRRQGQGALRQADRQERLHVRRVTDSPRRPLPHGAERR